MSEKILAFIFSLYPPAFRERYLHEALLLYRDRIHHETGPYRRLMLACDLFVDFFAALPIAWQRSYSPAIAQPQTPIPQQVPSFGMLHSGHLRPRFILLGSIFSIAGFTLFVLVLRTTALYPIQRRALSPIESVLQRLNQPALPPQQNSDVQKSPGDSSTPSASPQPLTPNKNTIADSQKSIPVPQSATTQVKAPTKLLAIPLQNEEHHPLAATSSLPFNLSARTSINSTPELSSAPSQTSAASAQQPVEPEDATVAMIRAISAHQVVMFGETHGNKQEYEWLCKLVKTPAFADRVDDIVVEFGNSLYQKTVDRYIAGEDVPQPQIEKAWRNMIGAVGPISPVYGEFYNAVRDSNLQRRGGHQIRLLLGDPYGDWEKIQTREDLGPYLAHRDQWYAQMVHDEVLAHHHRALLIMGAGHFLRRTGPGLVEQTIRDAGVRPYLVVFGTNAVGHYDDLDRRFDSWSLPAIVSLSGSWVGKLPANPVLTGGEVAPNSQKMEDVADAMLYVGSRDTLTQVFVPRSELVDTAYGKEVERRLEIQTGRTMPFTNSSEGPQYQKPEQQIVSNGVHRLPPNPPRSASDPLPPRPPSQ